MKVDEWLGFFKQHPSKKLFSLSDLTQLIEEPKTSLTVQLTRLTKANILTRVAQGWYANPFHSPNPEEIAMVLRFPSYLSLEYALARQGVLSQRPYTITVITTRSPYTVHREKHVYEYHQIHKKLFWGYSQEDQVLIASPEKALLDLLYIRVVRTQEVTITGFRSLLADMDLESIQQRRLQEYAKRFGTGTMAVAQELGLLGK